MDAQSINFNSLPNAGLNEQLLDSLKRIRGEQAQTLFQNEKKFQFVVSLPFTSSPTKQKQLYECANEFLTLWLNYAYEQHLIFALSSTVMAMELTSISPKRRVLFLTLVKSIYTQEELSEKFQNFQLKHQGKLVEVE